MPVWKGIHAFSIETERRALARWSPSPGAREAVLGVAKASLDLVERKRLTAAHLEAFVRSAELPAPEPRAWRPGAVRVIQAAQLGPGQGRQTLRRLLARPLTAARLLAADAQTSPIDPADRLLALEALLGAPEAERDELLADDALRLVRLDVQRLDAERRPRGVEATLEELDRQLDPARRGGAPTRESAVLLQELRGRLKPKHVRPLLGLIERWPEDDAGGFLVNLVEAADAVRGGRREVIESFRRRPTLAVAVHLHYSDARGWRELLRQALRRRGLPRSLRDNLQDFLDELDDA